MIKHDGLLQLIFRILEYDKCVLKFINIAWKKHIEPALKIPSLLCCDCEIVCVLVAFS